MAPDKTLSFRVLGAGRRYPPGLEPSVFDFKIDCAQLLAKERPGGSSTFEPRRLKMGGGSATFGARKLKVRGGSSTFGARKLKMGGVLPPSGPED